MSKWETQGRINLKILSVEEDDLYLERFLRLPFCYIIASPCQPAEGEAVAERKSYRCLSSNLTSSMMMDGCWQVPTGVSSLFTWENQISTSEEPRASVTRNVAGPRRECLPSSLHRALSGSKAQEFTVLMEYQALLGKDHSCTKYTMTKSPYFSMF